MTAIAIQIDSRNFGWASALAASLPVSLTRSDDPAGIILLDGASDWADRLAGRMKAGHRRFLVVDPAIPPEAALDRTIALAAETGADVMISETHGDNPAVESFRKLLAGPHSVVTITGIGMIGLAELVLQQLRLARRLGLESVGIVQVLASEGSLIATLDAWCGGAPLLLRLTLTQSSAIPACHRLTAHAPTETAFIELASEPDARPATAYRANLEGGLELPTIYESAHRAALKLLAGQGLAASRGVLAGWKEDAMLATAIAGVG
jgi:hypothetical protein